MTTERFILASGRLYLKSSSVSYFVGFMFFVYLFFCERCMSLYGVEIRYYGTACTMGYVTKACSSSDKS